MKRGRFRLWLLLLAAVAMIAGACGDTGDEPGDTAATPTTGATVDNGADLGSLTTIKLAVNPWTGSEVNVAVAKQLLEQIGYTVEVTSIDENAQWAAIGAGDLHASLEVWPSGHAENVETFIDGGGGVVNGGLLGPIGKIGWYLPSYVVDQNPELATWEGFQDPALAGLFATAETGDRGQFLGGDPSFVQYDEQIIENLGLEMEVVFAGSEEALLAALDSAVSRQEPIVFYFWTPHSVHNAYDLTEVALPEYTDECYADPAAVDCDYPADELFKIVWEDLETEAPAAYALLTNMSYTTADQIEMLAAVETDGKTVDEAAADWIAANQAVWETWMP